MPRLVRRRPFAERIKDYLNVWDLWIWLSEEWETNDQQWDSYAYPTGVLCNLVMVIARATSGTRVRDDVFDDDSSSGFWKVLVNMLVTTLTLLSFTNAFLAFFRKRHYRLFEKSVENAPPGTPSVHRVRVDSSPVSSPLRFLTAVIQNPSASSRAHPDAKKEVWELGVWDPKPTNLKLFCSFSPGHVLVYLFFLPAPSADPRPSLAIFTTLFMAALLSAQLIFMQRRFSQQSRDMQIVHQEVMNEYDTKYVHPRTQPVMRDVGTQFDDDHGILNTCQVYTPVIVVNRGFRTNPNPNYAGLVDPEGTQTPTRSGQNFGDFRSPPPEQFVSPTDARSRPPRAYKSTAAGDGGNLGIYTHAQSPLKKVASTNFATGKEARQGASQRPANSGSPLKRTSYPTGVNGVAGPRLSR